MRRVALIVVLIFLAREAAASDGSVHRVPPEPDHLITGLELPSSDTLEPDSEVSESKGQSEVQVSVMLSGKYAREHWTLVWGPTVVALDSQGGFQLRVAIQSPSTLVSLVGVGPRGEVEDQTIELLFPDYDDYVQRLKETAALRPTHFSFGLGFTSVFFSESNVPDYSSISLTAKFTYAHALFSPNWDFAATGYATLFAITKNVDPTARFVGLNVRAGYVIPQIRDPWRLSILGGIYYTSMFVSDGSFGIKNLAGPQLYPTFRRALRKGEAISAYFKFSPISDGFTVLSLSNREIAGGLSYQRTLANGHPFSVNLDLASLALFLDNVTISSTTITLGAGYGF